MAVDDKILAMLAIIESDTATDGEKENATSRIQHFATIHSIDLERLRTAKNNRSKAAEPITRQIEVGERGRQHKNRFGVDMALAVGRNNDLMCTIAHDRSYVVAHGFETDIEFADALFKSLMTQMVMACNTSLANGEHKVIGVHGKTYRPNFYEAFIRRISSRLSDAKDKAIEDAKKQDEEIASRLTAAVGTEIITDTDESASTGTDMVLATKKEKVNKFYDETTKGKLARGSYRSYGAGNKSYGAQDHGRTAANRASLGSTTALAGGKNAIN